MRVRLALISLFASAVVACTTGQRDDGPDANDASNSEMDAGTADAAGHAEMDAGCPGREDGPTAEVCNGSDDDCDGVADNYGGNGTSTRLSTGTFAGPCWDGTFNCYGTANVLCRGGTAICSEGSFSTVSQAPVGPSDEVCNGYDDDCDEMTDNAWPGSSTKLGTSTYWSCAGFVPGCLTYLATRGQCRAGTNSCGAANATNPSGTTSFGVVVSEPVGPSLEVCNGLDDDCDDLTDEDCQ